MLLYLLAVADLGQRATLLMESPQSHLDGSSGILYDRGMTDDALFVCVCVSEEKSARHSLALWINFVRLST